jgi:hypothetical protein
VHLRYDPRSRASADRRTIEGLSMPEIIRCQKRYLALTGPQELVALSQLADDLTRSVPPSLIR